MKTTLDLVRLHSAIAMLRDNSQMMPPMSAKLSYALAKNLRRTGDVVQAYQDATS